MSTETSVGAIPGQAARPAERLGAGRARPGLFDLVVALAVLADLYAIFAISPAERVQGDVFRIVYVHVPMGWLCYVAFATVFVASMAYLWKRRPGADHLARALVHDPDLLLLDEPDTGLDASGVELLGLAIGRPGRTVILTSHNPERAARLAPRALLLVDGRAVADGPTAAVGQEVANRPGALMAAAR